MSATPSDFSSPRGFSHERVGPAHATEPRQWTARNTLMFLVGATGLLWAGVIFGATLFL